MNNKFNLIIFVILILASVAAAQTLKNKLQFSVLSQNGNFYKELKDADIKIAGAENLSLTQKLDISLEIIIMID